MVKLLGGGGGGGVERNGYRFVLLTGPMTTRDIVGYPTRHDYHSPISNKTLGRAQDPRTYGAWLSELTE